MNLYMYMYRFILRYIYIKENTSHITYSQQGAARSAKAGAPLNPELVNWELIPDVILEIVTELIPDLFPELGPQLVNGILLLRLAAYSI